MPWLMSVLGIAATILNANQIRGCFVLYIITNIIWTWHNAQIKEYAQSGLCFIYLLMAIWGLYSWQ